MNLAGAVPGIPDAEVHLVKELPDALPGGASIGMYMQAAPNALLITMPRVARYLVRDGKTIEIAPEPDADPGAVAAYLYGSARSALIHQRGELPLHAASLVPPGASAAVAFCGSSGAGKSTLAAELSRRGWSLLADDTTRVSWDGSRPIAWPSREHIKLWRDACARLNLDPASLTRVRRQMEKFLIAVPTHGDAAPLSAVVELVSYGKAEMQEIETFERIAILSRHTFRPRQIRALGQMAGHMDIVSQVAGSIRAFRLGGARLAEPAKLADAVAGIVS
jgi:hypothetical protein